MLGWIGIAMLAVSWLPGLSYYHLSETIWLPGLGSIEVPNWTVWAGLVAAGTACLLAVAPRPPGIGESAVAALGALPGAWVAPWPYRAALLAIALGAALRAWPVALGWTSKKSAQAGRKGRWSWRPLEQILPGWAGALLGRPSTALALAGCILAAQAVAMLFYAALTSKSHELPAPLPKLLGQVAAALAVETGVYQSDLALYSMRRPQVLGATWELLLDPATWCFLAGGVVLVIWQSGLYGPGADPGSPGGRTGRLLAWLVVPVVAWLPCRAGLMLAIYLHDVLRTAHEAQVTAMRLFWSTWVHLLLLAGPVLLAWRLVPRPGAGQGGTGQNRAEPSGRAGWRPWRAGLLVAAGAACLCGGVTWDPPGPAKPGRVLVEEYHWVGDRHYERSQSSERYDRTRTDKPYDTQWYGELSGYNHYCLFDYASRWFQMARYSDRELTEEALGRCDVLVLKVPARPYSNKEIDAIERFVRRGGGLLLIGDHTNVYGSALYLNAVADRFGFRFRHDCLLGIDTPWRQQYRPPLVPHPIVQHLREMDFATSCSIEPRTWRGRGVIRSVGLKNSMPDYHATNLQPGPDDHPEMRYGAFVQLWTTRFGRGRVAAFTDSTIFSNFCAFEPGKRELWMGLLQWLNHRSPWIDPRWPLMILGLALCGAGLWLARRDGVWTALIGAASLGWTAGVLAVNDAHRLALPPLPPKDCVEVVMDQAVCSVVLPRSGTVDVRDDSFGIFERWVLRLGYFTARLEGPEQFRGNLLVFLHPDLPVSDQFRQQVARYVEQGGKLLVVEVPPSEQAERERTRRQLREGRLSPRQAARKAKAAQTGPQANRLLEPFGLAVEYDQRLEGQLQGPDGWPAIPVTDALVVQGGQPFAWVNRKPVGATLPVGNKGGSVTLIGFGERFKDAQMGGTDHVEPDKLQPEQARELKNVYQWHFGLFRALAEGRALGHSAAGPPKMPGR
ncbi:MAG: hypothetical protein ACUVUC_02905 [Thermoguttaceae bacterium]